MDHFDFLPELPELLVLMTFPSDLEVDSLSISNNVANDELTHNIQLLNLAYIVHFPDVHCLLQDDH